MSFSIRSHRYGLPLITILVFAVSLLLGLDKLLEESRENPSDIKKPLYWSASQTVVEYWRFVGALDRYVATPDAATLDAVMFRLDILWSRIGLYQTGEVGKRLRMIEGATETIPALADTLREIEPLLPALNADDRSAIAVIRDRLASYAHPLQQMAQQTNLFEQSRAVDFREGHAHTHRLLLALLFGVILSGTPLILLLFRETRATSRLLAAAEAAEATAQDAAERLGAVLDNSVVSIVTIDDQGTITSFNPAAERLFGYSAADAVSKNVTMLMPEEDAALHQRHLDTHPRTAAIKVTVKTREQIARRADGSAFPIEISVGAMRHGGRVHFVGFIVDISERKKAENALKSSEQRFRDIAEIAGDWIWETDKDGRYTYFSDQMEKVTGLKAEDILGKTRKDLPWADNNDPKWWRLNETISAQEPFRDYSFAVRGPNIETRQVRISGKPIFNAMGEFGGYRGTGTDVSAQIEAEREAAQKTSLLHTTFENISQGINVIDADGRLAAFNSRFLELFELPPGTVVTGMPSDQITHYLAARGEYGPGDVDELVARRTSVSRHDRPHTDEHTRPNGTVLERRINPLPGGGFTATYTDITERKRVEEEYRQAQKMETIGRLIGGVAHEFNTLLTAIGGFAHLVNRQADKPELVREWTEDIISAADQAASLTSQLLSFSRKQNLEPKVVSVAKVLEETAVLVGPLVGGPVSLDIEMPDEEICVSADPGRLVQALLNLAINARDAMPDGGRLSIASRLAELDETATAGFEQAEPGRYVAISIADTGSGIGEDALAEIFEPFFTTKDEGEGTGLGLAMVYGMVQQSGGVITIDTEVDRGTVFTIYLPHLDEDVASLREMAEGKDAPVGCETVLLVEEDAATRHLMRITLKTLGYTVLAANDGMKAADIFQRHRSAIELLVAGVRLPGLDGGALASMMAAETPDLRVIFIAGEEDTGLAEEPDLAEGRLLLIRPLDPEDFAKTVRDVLDSAPLQTSAA
jgi:PAS domain S-box-containing protein